MEDAGKKRLGVVAAALVAVLVIAGVAGWTLWTIHTGSPGYSIGQLTDAAKDRSWDRVQRYVDVDAILGQLVVATVHQYVNPQDAKARKYSDVLAQGLKPSFVKTAKQRWQKAVESGSAVNATTQNDVWSILNVLKVKSVTYAGGNAHVTVTVSNGNGTTMDLKLTMERAGHSWRVVAIENIADLPLSPPKTN